MKIITKQESIFLAKPQGVDTNYYLRDEYEVHYNEWHAGATTKAWHHHEKIIEAVYIIEGEVTVEWEGNNKIVRAGDLIETEKTPHTFTNHTDKTTKLLVIKLVPTGESKKEIFKNDKVIDKE